MSQDATRPVHPNSRTMQSTADSALVCEHGNVGRGCGFVVTCRARILTLGSGSCRLDTPAAPTGDPSHARGAVAGCVDRLPAFHVTPCVNRQQALCQSSKQPVVHTRQKVFEVLALRRSGYTSPSTRLCCAGKTCQRLHRDSLVTR
jgi:hypothetical protein